MAKTFSARALPVRVATRRSTPVAAALGLALGLVAMPGTADAGFFEQLFGIQQAPAPEAPPALSAPGAGPAAPRRLRRPSVHKRVEADAKGGRQTPTDLMHDATLHHGDAVMMKDGLHVYEGGGRSVHASDDFVPLDDSGVSRKTRQMLASVDTTRAAVTEADAGKPGTLASGRSAAVSAPINEGFVFTDPNGRKLRYVGP